MDISQSTILTEDTKPFGFDVPEMKEGHNWAGMRESVQNHIRGLNFNYRVNLREKDVTYKNALGKVRGEASSTYSL